MCPTRRYYQQAQHATRAGREAKTTNGARPWEMSKMEEMVLKFKFLALKNPIALICSEMTFWTWSTLLEQ